MEELQAQIEQTQSEINEIGANLFYLERNQIRKDDIVFMRFKEDLEAAERKMAELMAQREYVVRNLDKIAAAEPSPGSTGSPTEGSGGGTDSKEKEVVS